MSDGYAGRTIALWRSGALSKRMNRLKRETLSVFRETMHGKSSLFSVIHHSSVRRSRFTRCVLANRGRHQKRYNPPRTYPSYSGTEHESVQPFLSPGVAVDR